MSERDYIGFDPTANQAEFGLPRITGYGIALKDTPPMGGVNYFPSNPFRGTMNFTGLQVITQPFTDSLFAQTHGYRGIAPLDLQPLIERPYPYEW